MQSETYKGLTINYEDGQNEPYSITKAKIERIASTYEAYAIRNKYTGVYATPISWRGENVLSIYLNGKDVQLGMFNVKDKTISRNCDLKDIKIDGDTIKNMDFRAENITSRGLIISKKEPLFAAWKKELEITRDPISIRDKLFIKEFSAAYAEYQNMNNRINSTEISREDIEL